MAFFIRLLDSIYKEESLKNVVERIRSDSSHVGERLYEIDPAIFQLIEGSPFSYWANPSALNSFKSIGAFKNLDRLACATNDVGDDKRFYRLWWEVKSQSASSKLVWVPLSKGGKYSPFYFDLNLVVSWSRKRNTYFGFTGTKHRPLEKPASIGYFFNPGLSWPHRTTSELGMRVLPAGSVFANKGPCAFVKDFDPKKSLVTLAICNSAPFRYLVSLQLAAADSAARSYDVGVINRTPFPETNANTDDVLSALARRAWLLKWILDSVDETSHAFELPAAIRARLGDYDPPLIEAELTRIQSEIDDIAFGLYDFREDDRAAVKDNQGVACDGDVASNADDESEDADNAAPIGHTAGLLSWAFGVAFGRFDWRLATDEYPAPAEPDPFDPLPVNSPGMLREGVGSFHDHAGILVDDPGHHHDLARLVEEVLCRADVSIPDDVRRWLRKDFFALHLQRYSKSRRKAPIYWPLATTSGSYVLWIYYPSLNSQTLFKAVNDFLDGPNGKLTQVSRECTELRMKGSGRSREEEEQYERQQTLEQELTDLRDALLKIAPTYQPNHDDGVQITAAPLWPLFRHKPWQKVLRDTWTKLEKGEYDWAHLAMSYWPERIRAKCQTDKSLAIAHGLEELYVEPEAKTQKARKVKA